jgi:hypothetical protein
MKRRDFLKKAGMGSTAASLPFFLSWACRSASNVDSRPNILFIMSDDHAAPSIREIGVCFFELRNNPSQKTRDR